MGLNETPSGERIHIGFFGRRNAGKSSVVNAVTGQDLAVVSDTLGTTTDPVMKAMELLPMGPVMIIDTPGFLPRIHHSTPVRKCKRRGSENRAFLSETSLRGFFFRLTAMIFLDPRPFRREWGKVGRIVFPV